MFHHKWLNFRIVTMKLSRINCKTQKTDTYRYNEINISLSVEQIVYFFKSLFSNPFSRRLFSPLSCVFPSKRLWFFISILTFLIGRIKSIIFNPADRLIPLHLLQTSLLYSKGRWRTFCSPLFVLSVSHFQYKYTFIHQFLMCKPRTI